MVAHAFNPKNWEAEVLDFWVHGQCVLQSEFQDSQGYTEKPSPQNSKDKTKQNKQTNKNPKNQPNKQTKKKKTNQINKKSIRVIFGFLCIFYFF